MLTHILFGQGSKDIAILIPQKDMEKKLLIKHYIEPLERKGIPRESVIALSLAQNETGKSPVKLIRSHLTLVEGTLKQLNIKRVLICDSAYFKTICKVRKSEPHYGYPKKTVWKGVIGFISANYRALFYNPAMAKKIEFSLKALTNHAQNKLEIFANDLLTDCWYPTTEKQIAETLNEYLKVKKLTCDIEAYSLKVDKASIATICFAIDKHTGVAFNVGQNRTIRKLLKDFFTNYTGKLIFHGSPYDCKVIIWELFMENGLDYKGMLEGLHIMFKNLEDTKILAYLALNSTAGISLSLKDLAFEFSGNYALDDIQDITKINPVDLLTYNMTDGLATWFIYDLYKPEILASQNTVYKTLFLPALKVITQMELCGMPINLGQVLNAQRDMEDIAKKHFDAIMQTPLIAEFTTILREWQAEKANLKLKKLRKTKDDFLDFNFNPNSHTQLAQLFHTHLDLPILSKTDTGAPSTDNKTLTNLVQTLKHKKSDANLITLIEHIIELADVSKILNTFIPAFKNNSISKAGWQYLHGGFNLGGTKSGRLSSSKPNLQQIPSTGTKYAKIIKQCFQPPPKPAIGHVGWLMVGADYFSLEDRISALLTKDPNKLKIYTDGYCGHCLRAYKYFGESMPDINPDSVKSINSIAIKYPDLRQLSKSPTFLLTYMGTAHGLMKQFGFSKDEAIKIETDYHDLYSVSDEWVMEQIRKASKTGYVELAFGVRLRTPILPQVIIDSESIPFQAHKEIKTAGNALGQSYGLLNTRSANEFMERVWVSEYSLDVLPLAQIHDSQYYMIKNTIECLKWVNDNLIECMEWNQLAPIQHPEVKLGAALEIYYPDWSTHINVPNRISEVDLKELLKGV